jgi:hypothetical protein
MVRPQQALLDAERLPEHLLAALALAEGAQQQCVVVQQEGTFPKIVRSLAFLKVQGPGERRPGTVILTELEQHLSQ